MPYKNIGPKNGTGVRITWVKDSHMQAVVAPFTEGMPEEEFIHGDGATWMDFTERRHVNDLIRALRDARDDVFGKDA